MHPPRRIPLTRAGPDRGQAGGARPARRLMALRACLGAAVLALTAAGGLRAHAAPAPSPADAGDPGMAIFRPAPCPEVAGEAARAAAPERLRCGWLDRRESPVGRALSLPVVVIAPAHAPPSAPAGAPDSAARPLVFLHGGPGGEAVSQLGTFARHPMAAQRPVILFDQRGSGRARPLDCPDTADRFLAVLARDLPPAAAVEAQAQVERACRAQMLAAGADLAGYGTRQTVGDLEALRRALDISAWDVMGVSYGTTVALDYARRHPDAVGALVLDSVYPPAVPSGGDVATRNFARALAAIAAACRAQAPCNHAFPDPEAAFLATLDALARAPLAVPVRDPALVPSGTFWLNSQDLALIVHQMLYQRETAALVPMLVDLAARRNGPALAGVITLLGPLARRIDLGARLAVECRDRWGLPGRRLHDLDQRARALRRHFRFFDTEDVLCPDWSATRTPADFHRPVSLPLPALFLAGALDPITPPAYTRAVHARFPAGRYVLAPHTGHGVDRAHACARTMTARFLDAPHAPLADACAGAIAPVTFVTGAAFSAGVPPFAQAVLLEVQPLPAGLLALGLLAGLAGAGLGLRALARTSNPGLRAGWMAAGLLGLASVAGVVFHAGLLAAIARAAGGPHPAILALGLPPDARWILALPWVVAALWGAGALLLAAALRAGAVPGAPRRPLLVAAASTALVIIQLWAFGFFTPAG